MKKFIYFFLFFLVSFAANSQTQPSGLPSPRSDSGFAQYNWVRALKGGIIFPERDTAFTPTYIGTVVFWRNAGVDSSLWVYAKTTGRKWSKVVTLSGGVSAGTVTAISTNDATGITGGTITTSGTLSLDTTIISTRLWRQKGIDSVQFNLTNGLALKVNISDTALMLSPYLRKSDTTGLLSNYVPITRTITTNTPLFGGGNLSTNRTFGIDTGRAVAQVVTGGSLTAVKDSLLSVIASSGGGTVLSVSTTNGFGINSSVATATSTPDITIAVDTFAVSTRAWRNKGIDSVQNNLTNGLALKLNLSDTAAMLSNRLKISDTAFMLMPFMQYSDTSFMLSPYRRTSTKITNSDLVNSTISGISLGSNLATLTFGQYLQVGASSYNGSAATTITTNGTSTNAGSTLVARDINGDFSARNISATLLGNASSASTVGITNDITTNATYYPMFSTVTTGSTSTNVSSTKLTYNPSSGNLSATTFTGNLTGNASTATVLQTPRTINGVAFDGSANITISAAVGNSLTAGYGITGSPFDGSLARTWEVDTSNISTKANVTGALVAKLNISDTASMLSGYKTYYPRTAISAGTGISYNAATGVITNSSPSSGGTVTSVATNNGSGITGGTITSTGTIAADTSILSTKANVTGLLVGYTTVAANGLKLNISDTATMLSNYRRKTTLIENADLRNSAITINGSSTALGGSISVGTVTSVAASAGTGISVSGSPITTSGTLTITNTAPDQTVTLTSGTGISVTGTYPNFTVTNSSPSSGGTVTSVSAGTGMSFTTITSSGAVNADTTVLATRAYAAGLDVAKANTSLNNVNGVLSSTYGGAGSVSGILKANGSGVVSAAVAGDITALISGTYLPLSGGTLTGALSGTSLSMSGAGSFGTNLGIAGGVPSGSNVLVANGSALLTGGLGVGTNISLGSAFNLTWGGNFGANVPTIIGVSGAGSYLTFYPSGSTNGEAARLSNGGNLLLKTTTDNGTDALQVAGSVSATSSVTASSFVKSGGTSAQFLKADGSVDGNTYLTSASVGDGTLTMNVSGSGLSGSQTFTANQSGNATFTVTSNATTAATASTIAYRDGSGNLNAAGFFESSDKRLKDIISRDGDVAYFKWKDGKDDKIHIGYIAQEVEKTNPDQVKKDENGYLSVNYTEILVQKIRELERKIEKLERKTKKTKN